MTASNRLAAGLAGKTLRFTWNDDGPAHGVAHEHVFHPDGTVEWRVDPKPVGGRFPARRARSASIQPLRQYVEEGISRDVRLVSYLSPRTGCTLTVLLNARSGEADGVVAADDEWKRVSGRYEVLSAASRR